MGSYPYPKTLVEGPLQTFNDDCSSFVSRSDGARTIQWNMLTFIINVISIWWQILNFLWHLQFIQI